MREGYIDSELGEIPVSWNILDLKDISTIVTGSTPKTAVGEYYNGDFPWITPTDINSLKDIYDSPRKLTSLGLAKGRELPPNTLLVTCIASIGKNAILRKKGSCNQQINAILPNENHHVDFLYYMMNYSTDRLIKLAGTTAIAIINKSTFSRFKITLPPLPEQQNIAEILCTVDDKIDVIDQQISETQALKKGLMQRLLTKGIGHTEFKDSTLGVIPKSWDVKLLEDCAKRGSGHTPDKKMNGYYDGGIKWVSLGDSNKLDNRYISETKIEISIEGLKNSSAVLHPKETVLLSRDAGVGKSAVMKIEMAVSQHFITWQCDENFNNWFLYFNLQALKPTFERVAIGSTIKTIGLGFFKKMRIVVPPIKEQIQIASILNSVEDKIEVLEDKKTSYQELKKGLMQQLLTGKIRVNGLINKTANA